MKYEINTYEDYLKLSLNDIIKISEDDFDLYTDYEHGLITAFNSQFKSELFKFTSDSLAMEERVNRLLTDEEFYNWQHWKILLFFGSEII